MNLHRIFEIYSDSGEITSSGIYMLRSALKRLYETYEVAEGQEVPEDSYSRLFKKFESYLKSQNKTSKVIRENKYWIRRLIKFGVQKKYLLVKNDKISEDYEEYSSSNRQNLFLARDSRRDSSLPPSEGSHEYFYDQAGRGKPASRHAHGPDRLKIFKTPFIVKLILILLGLAMMAIVFIAQEIHWQLEDHVFDLFQEHQLTLSKSVAHGLQQFILELEDEITFLTQLPSVQLMDTECLTELNKAYQLHKKYIRSILLVDSSGMVPFGVVKGERKTQARLPDHIEIYFPQFKASSSQIHSTLIHLSGKDMTLLLSFPVNLKSSEVQGGLGDAPAGTRSRGNIMVELNLSSVMETYFRHVSFEDQVYGQLLDHDGTILYHPRPEKIGTEFLMDPKESSNLALYEYKQELLREIEQGLGGVSRKLQKYKDDHLVYAHSPVKIHDEVWSILVSAPYKEVHPVGRLHTNIAALMLVVICIGSLGGLILLKVNQKRIKLEDEFKYLEDKLEMEDKIRRSEERLRAILDSIGSDRISIIDRNYRVLWANRLAYQNYGDIIGRKCYQVYKGLDEPCHPCLVQETFADQKIHQSEELALDDKDGKSILYLTSSSPIFDGGGNVISVVETSKDITERMRFQEEIKGKLSLLDAILTKMNDGIRVIDAKNNILFMNQNLINIFGNQINKKCYRVFMGREVPCHPCALEKIFKESQQSFSFIKEDVNKQLVEVSASPLGAEGGGHSIIEVVRDITERIKLETQLMESEQRRIKELKERYRFGNIIGKSPKIQEIYELINIVAQNSTTVLLLGESGTGKELIARAIHYNSPQHDKPFVEVCCSVLSEHLLESELFGHVKGSFTGAIRDKIGRFEMADGGSLFLDEVGDISLNVQIKLLRVIQEREFIPVGGETVKKVNVRIIAATNKDLKKAVETKEFREDLYYRLNVVPIHVPPLRERMEDIPLLVNHFIEKFRDKINKPIHSIHTKAMNILMSSPWPGNVRELENAIEHAFIRCDGTVIRPEDLPTDLRQNKNQELKRSLDQIDSGKDLNMSELKKGIILKVLNETDWNPAEAAKKLNISRATYYRWIQKYNIKR